MVTFESDTGYKLGENRNLWTLYEAGGATAIVTDCCTTIKVGKVKHTS